MANGRPMIYVSRETKNKLNDIIMEAWRTRRIRMTYDEAIGALLSSSGNSGNGGAGV